MILYQPGDGVEGELLAFQCRKIRLSKKPVHATSAHQAIEGKLENGFCVINKKFRQIPDK